MKNKVYLYHIIYTLFLSASFSQNIHLKFKGSDSISQNYISNFSYKKQFQNIKSLNLEVVKTKKTLENLGYFNSHISKITKANDSTYLSEIKLNTKFNTIEVYYNTLQFSKKEIEKLLNTTTANSNSFTCPINQLENNLNKIITYLSEKGQVFSDCKLTNITTHENKVIAHLNINTSKTNYISKIQTKGYEKFPKKFIRHRLKLKEGQQLNLSAIEKKSNNLNYLKFANEIKKPEILFTKDSSVTYLYINKRKSNSFEGFLGFASDTETNKLKLNGNIDLKLINNLNTGEELYIKYQSTENEQQKIHFKTVIPYIFNSPISIEGQFDIFKKDSSFTNNTQTLQLKYNIHRNILIGAGIQFATSNSLEDNNPNNVDYKKTAYLLNFNHQTQNPHTNFFATKTKTQLQLSLNNRKTLNNKTNQQNISLESEYIFQINKESSFFLKNISNYLISNTVFENELQYIGGINSLRGYQENSIPSTQYSILNTEYRIELSNNLYTHTVIDYAITKNTTTNNNNNLFGFGLGFGLKTNNSILRFIVANRKDKSQNIKFSESKIHLSLSTLF